ncbi:MAG: AbrB/MazE/SpoVT family DNA-binding domain-containing protein [Desulfobacteraceae bacterium]|nr:MAG: AbrB/MazE/SpoVT family DNA-binding domain-containing protein [Desulfobacteraceae bacterium]
MRAFSFIYNNQLAFCKGRGILASYKYNYMKIQFTKENPMPAVKLGASRQVAIPKKIHDQLRLHPGDYLEIEVTHGKLILTPKTLIDKRLDEGLEDLRKGRVHGPYDSAKEMMASLRGKKRSPRR